MPDTVTTKETFAADIKEASLDEEVKLRMKAGAIKSRYEHGDGVKESTMFSVWNVIGENV